ncbi:Com family DNA-binding transcriptional regulator [Pandoraea sp.]|uniref:Com family DNA-binding transcriptional regulator n=1 Tax=Pandoraea sp. TaxID=1883445 RepID=UPI00121A9370|nr:Com family DNA-binding transcriptional regulator [Pandoraea sp.]TAL53813.1 MAG: Com family DNA-binding transcriptional regulator [Pandoraea sp.]TAM17066.1 MAG: Com family DNA-binding transcriptional regulator [Pandoraea sp.]
MKEIRCENCRRKLAMAEYTRLSIKCPRCRALNVLRAERPEPECRRASDSRKHSNDILAHSAANRGISESSVP